MQEKELRLIYIEGYRKKLSKQYENSAFSFFVEDRFLPLEDIAENETLFNSFISQSSIRYQYFKDVKLAHIMVELNIVMIHPKIAALFNSVK